MELGRSYLIGECCVVACGLRFENGRYTTFSMGGEYAVVPQMFLARAGMTRRLQDLVERIDVVLPEVAARVAALEHLLLELKLCTQEDLRSAREFVRIQEA